MSFKTRITPDLVADLFDAASDEASWSRFATIVATALGLDQAAVVVGRGTPFLDVSVTRDLIEISQAYDRQYQELDPWAARRQHFTSDRIMLASELVPEALFVRTEFYNDYASKIGMFRPITADVMLENGLRLEIGAEQPFAKKLLDEDDKQNLALLVP